MSSRKVSKFPLPPLGLEGEPSIFGLHSTAFLVTCSAPIMLRQLPRYPALCHPARVATLCLPRCAPFARRVVSHARAAACTELRPASARRPRCGVPPPPLPLLPAVAADLSSSQPPRRREEETVEGDWRMGVEIWRVLLDLYALFEKL